MSKRVVEITKRDYANIMCWKTTARRHLLSKLRHSSFAVFITLLAYFVQLSRIASTNLAASCTLCRCWLCCWCCAIAIESYPGRAAFLLYKRSHNVGL